MQSFPCLINKPAVYDETQRERYSQEQMREGTCYATMSGGGESYLSAFALFLHATPFQLSLLACVPPLVGTAIQFLSLKIIDRMQSRKPIVLIGAIAQAASWAPILLLPLFIPSYGAAALIMAVTLYWAFGDLTLPAWQSLITDLVPEDKRGRYFARRGTLASLAAFVALGIAGLVLHVTAIGNLPLLGFAMVFGWAGFARALSIIYLCRLPEADNGEWTTSRGIVSVCGQSRGKIFNRFVGFSSGSYMAVGLVGPFFVVYLFQELHWSFLQYGLWLAAPVVAQVLSLGHWGKLADQHGNKKVLLLTSVGVALMPLPYLISTDWMVLVLCNFVSGLVWAPFLLCLHNYLFDVIPPAIRPKAVAIWNTGNAIGTAVGALLGTVLLTALPSGVLQVGVVSSLSNLLVLFALSTVLRLVIVLTFLRNCEQVRPMTSKTCSALLSQLPLIRHLGGVLRRCGALAMSFWDLREARVK